MTSTNNSDTDNNVLTNFQPMPKRFMVWDKKGRQFFTIGDAYPLIKLSIKESNNTIFSLRDLAVLLSEVLYYDSSDDYVICQSTNLFDKDGKEIFEGSILTAPDDSLSVVEYDGDEGIFRTQTVNILDDMVCGGDYFEVVGHILSNPELLEDIK